MTTIQHKTRAISAKISIEEQQRIKDFIQGAVYCCCKNNKGKLFSARDLFGGDNYDWSGTPLIALFDWHSTNGSKNPVEMAGKDIGWLLLDVICRDIRMFEIVEGYTHEYRWIYDNGVVSNGN